MKTFEILKYDVPDNIKSKMKDIYSGFKKPDFIYREVFINIKSVFEYTCDIKECIIISSIVKKSNDNDVLITVCGRETDIYKPWEFDYRAGFFVLPARICIPNLVSFRVNSESEIDLILYRATVLHNES